MTTTGSSLPVKVKLQIKCALRMVDSMTSQQLWHDVTRLTPESHLMHLGDNNHCDVTMVIVNHFIVHNVPLMARYIQRLIRIRCFSCLWALSVAKESKPFTVHFLRQMVCPIVTVPDPILLGRSGLATS